MPAGKEHSFRIKAFTTFLSLGVFLALAALTYRVIRFWFGLDYVGANSFLLAPYFAYLLTDVKLLPLFGLGAVGTAVLYWISTRTGRQLLFPNYLSLTIFLLAFLFAGFVFFSLKSPVDRLISATTLSTRNFVALFDLQNPSLEAVRISYENQDYRSAENQLIDYFKSKHKAPSEMLSRRTNPQKYLDTANRALDRTFTFKGRSVVFPKDIDWHQGMENDPEWTYLFNRTYWFYDLVAAYTLTNQRRYIDGFSRYLIDWIEKNPLPTSIDETNPAWRLIDVGSRSFDSWIDSFKLILNSSGVDNSTRLLMLKSIHDHAQYLFYFHTTGTNHVLIESKGLLTLANEFPEFLRAKRWREVAIRRLDSEIRKQVYPDGGHVELSPDYHFQSLKHFAFPLRQSSSLYPLITPEYLEKLEAMRDYLFYTLKPDLRLPLLNDTNTKDVSTKLLKEARTSQRGDLRFIATHGKEGTSPSVRSRAFENSGVYVMRNNWAQSAQYLIFDAGPYGGWHGHEDKLSFELSAFGAPMIVDGGAYRYSGDEAYRAYFVSSAAHNTILVDGRGQSRRLLERNSRPERADESGPIEGNQWFSNGEIDFASGIYRAGYSKMTGSGSDDPEIDLSITHRRDIVYVKNDYFVVADTISGSGMHDVELLFHLPPGSMPQILNESVSVRYPNGATLKILSGDQGLRDISIINGQREPIQGWFSSETYEAIPAPVVNIKYTTELPTNIYTVLIPEAPRDSTKKHTPTQHITVEKTGCTNAELCLEVRSPKWEDRIVFQTRDTRTRKTAGFVRQHRY